MSTDDTSDQPSNGVSPITQGVKEVGQTATAGTVYYEYANSDSESDRLLVVSLDGDLIWVETISELTTTTEAVSRLTEDFEIIDYTEFGQELGLEESSSETQKAEQDATESKSESVREQPTEITESEHTQSTTESNVDNAQTRSFKNQSTEEQS